MPADLGLEKKGAGTLYWQILASALILRSKPSSSPRISWSCLDLLPQTLLALLIPVSELRLPCARSIEVSPLCHSGSDSRQLSPKDQSFLRMSIRVLLPLSPFTDIDAGWYSTYTWRLITTFHRWHCAIYIMEGTAHQNVFLPSSDFYWQED